MGPIEAELRRRSNKLSPVLYRGKHAARSVGHCLMIEWVYMSDKTSAILKDAVSPDSWSEAIEAAEALRL